MVKKFKGRRPHSYFISASRSSYHGGLNLGKGHLDKLPNTISSNSLSPDEKITIETDLTE